VKEDRGILVIVSSPSGAGKTTLTRRLLAEFPSPRLTFSVSHTTRPIRPGERDGIDYHFVEVAEFQRMVAAGDFAEHAVVFTNQYGTAKAPIERTLSLGGDMIFDVDWQGGQALSALWPRDSLKIFILPPDLATLADRLRRRATDAPDVIERRLRKAIDELGHFNEYEHLIVNDDLERAYQVLRALYLTRRYGVVDRPDVAYPLAKLATVVEENRARPNLEHARTLIADASGPVAVPGPGSPSAP
jgi:guanylate kinase